MQASHLLYFSSAPAVSIVGRSRAGAVSTDSIPAAEALSTINGQLMSTESSAGPEPLKEPLKCFSSQGKLCNTPLGLIYLTGMGALAYSCMAFCSAQV